MAERMCLFFWRDILRAQFALPQQSPYHFQMAADVSHDFLVQVDAHKAVSTLEDRILQRSACLFAEQGFLHLPDLLSAEIKTYLNGKISGLVFKESVHEVGAEQTAVSFELANQLNFILWQSDFVKFIEKVTATRIMDFAGRLYQLKPNCLDHHFDWHNDLVVPPRQVGLSLNLSPGPYLGGQFQIRSIELSKTIHTFHNTNFGDAFIFRIDENWQHRVTSVVGQNPKISFAGWFR